MPENLPPFPSRKTIITAANLLKALGHSGFESFLLELGLADPEAGTGGNLVSRATSLARFAIDHPQSRTAEGHPVGAAIVAKAGEIYRRGMLFNLEEGEREAFQAASAGDGAMGDVASPDWDPARPAPTVFQADPFRFARNWVVVEGPSEARNRKIFIVHGHDEVMRETVARFVTALGFEPVVLAEQSNGGRTIIEKFEQNADVGYALILLSPDDAPSGHGAAGRARQNVVLEWGYFIGRLGRGHVCALKKGEVDLPSDILGIVWETFDAHGGWKRRVTQELNDAGFDIDFAKALRA
ncbi:TIR domain-containing protein [Rhizobium laguerreae]|uniref:TIR domain-containing protein n=1 Tax=Rhizobium laguerreae TaxID=1076926 RepID=UPI001C911463|nr:nucleotide-binding protein [Rhizobium laguerreae]